MGAVYRATDTSLGRQVAIKVLPDALANDPERLTRFEREAKTLAALNHPNIAAIYGFERSSGTQALVMELVEGDDLSQRIARGPIPLDDALPIARQIAEALEAAHEQDIVHRDLKPANIKVRADGTVKVLDFGLAKALEPPDASATVNVSQLATVTTPAMTEAGIILGTAAYMSPEQARGRPVDRRADTWALGCVLYEMLSGQRAFEGETIADVLGAVLRAEPDWSRIPQTTPAAITTLIRRCLRKDVRQRLADAGAIRLEIDDAAAALGRPADALAAAPPASPASRRISLPAAVAIATAMAVLAATAGYWWQGRGLPRTTGSFARVSIPIPFGTELTTGASVALSPDGGILAFVAARDGISELYLRRLAEPDAHVVTDTRGATAPFFSPDSEWVAFVADGRLKKVSTKTGVMTSVTDSAFAGVVTGTADWASDDRIVAIDRGATLAVIPAGGGPAQRVSLKSTSDRAAIRSVSWLPGGTAVLVGVSPPNSPTGDLSVMIVSLDTGETRTVVERGASPRYLQTGHLVFVQDGTLKAVSFNPSTLEVGGTPVDVLSGVRQQTFNMHAIFSCSEAGSCAYIAGGTAKSRTILSVDRTGTARPLGVPPNSYTHPRFSPSGDQLAWWVEQLECEIEIYDIARGTTVRMKPTGDSHFPTWTPDGRAISFAGRRTSGYSIFSIAADGSGTARPLTPTSLTLDAITPFSWTPEGALVFATKGDLWVVDGAEAEPRVLEETAGNETTPAVSPDGRWLAYASDNAGRLDVYVRPFPGGGERYVISSSGGSEPVWARSGRELFFRSGDRFMVVDIGSGPAFTASRPRLMFTIRTQTSPGRTSYDVSPDGQTFVMTDAGEEERAAQQVTLLQNWFDELARLAPGPATRSN
jgi:serine/threonine-protein kinase